LGPVDVAEGEAELERRFGRDSLLFADTADAAKARIDSLETARELAALVSEVVALRSAHESQTAAHGQELDVHRAAVTETARELAAVVAEMAALRSSLESQAAAHGQELDAYRAAATENLRSFSHQFRLLSRQVDMLQFGPGEPQTPCVSGQHRGFQLVHYQGHVYALRRPMEPGEVQLGDRELLERHGSVNVVVGDSLDGVRARIDVLEGLKEMEAEVSSLDHELSTSGTLLAGRLREMQSEISSIRNELQVSSSRLAGDFQQADTTLQSHARDLERLARSWPNRLLGILPR
jgi:hypothetical protein